MKQHANWEAVLKSAYRLQLLDLLEKTAQLTSTAHYVFAVAYKQHTGFYNFHQYDLGNNACYSKFNTRVKVAKAIGIHWADTNCLNWVIENCKEFMAHKGKDYEDLDKDV
jgi:hypothetical protein